MEQYMSNVNRIVMPANQVTIYKKTFSFTNENLYVKGTNTQGYIRLTVYSTYAAPESITTTQDDSLRTFLLSLGYLAYGSYSAISIPIDNPYECEFNNANNVRCPYASFSSRSSGTLIFFSVPDATSTNGGTFTVTSTEWEPYFTTSVPVTQEFKYYLNSTAGSYTRFEVSSDISTGQEYISNYVINGVSYPNVTISSDSGNIYTLSDGNTYTVYTTFNPSIALGPGSDKEVYSILDITGNILWEKANAYGYYIKVGSYYVNKGNSSYVTTSTTASTLWYIDTNNYIYCLEGNTKYWLFCQQSGNYTVSVYPSPTSGYQYLYKYNNNYIRTSINGVSYYLYRYGSGNTGVRMHTATTVVTFKSNDPRTHTAGWHTIWEDDYSITCEAIDGQMYKEPYPNRVIYHIHPKLSSFATAYSDMKIKVYYQFDWIGDKGTSTPGNAYITEYTVSDLSSDKPILNLPVNPTDSRYSSTDFIASGVAWDATTGNITFENRGYLHSGDREYMKTTIRITKIELYC